MSQVEEVKSKVDIVDVVSSYLVIKKTGRNFRGLCPFHKEKTPSFMVNPEKQIWYCFGCSEGGDVFSFLQKIENIDFISSLKMLAQKTGVVLDGSVASGSGKKEKYLAINDVLAKFYQYILLNSREGGLALDYMIKQRQISREMIDIFCLGYAPAGPSLACDFLIKKGYEVDDLISLGIGIKDSRGRLIDKMRERIIFPIFSPHGRVLGFGGRIIKDYSGKSFIPPKYLNSPQSPVYDKSQVLYGLFQAKDYIREDDYVVVVEGYLDVISSYSAGVKSVVASSGTAFTHNQMSVLSRYTKNIIACFDSDRAGVEALKRLFYISQDLDLEAKGVVLENFKDPDDLARSHPDLWKSSVGSAKSIVQILYENLISSYDINDVAQKKKAYSALIQFIASIKNSVEKNHYIKRVGYDFGVSEKNIEEDLSSVKLDVGRKPHQDSEESTDFTQEKRQFKVDREMLLIGALIGSNEVSRLITRLSEELFENEKTKNIYKYILEWHNIDQSNKIPLKDFLNEKIVDRKHQEDIALMCFLAESFFEGMDASQVGEDINLLIDVIVHTRISKKKKDIEKKIYLLNKKDDKEKIKDLLRELQGLI